MNKKIPAVILSVAMLASTLAFSSCNKYKKTPKDFVAPYSYDLTPYVTLGEYKGVTYSKQDTTVTEDQIDAKVNEALADKATEEVVTDRGVKTGDILTINYYGTMDGVEFEGGTATDQTLEIGSNKFIPGFEDGLIGAMPDETRTLHLQFPDPYQTNPDYSGKDVDFTVLVRYIKAKTLPELTDEFIAENTDYQTLAEYRDSFVSTLESENADTAHKQIMSDVWSVVSNNAEIISIPEDEVTKTAEKTLESYTNYAKQYNMELEDFINTYSGNTYDAFKEYIQSYSESLVSQNLVLYSIVAKEKMTLTDKEYDEGMADLAKQNDTTVEDLESTYTFEELWDNLMWSKVVNFLVDNAVAGDPVAATEASTGTEAAGTQSETVA